MSNKASCATVQGRATIGRVVALALSFKDPTPTETYTLSLHDALPICAGAWQTSAGGGGNGKRESQARAARTADGRGDRKSTRLNSSHVEISYAVFCLKKKSQDRRGIETILHELHQLFTINATWMDIAG